MSVESIWIERIKNDSDSEALDNLVKRYQPMIDNMASQYFIVGFDRDDWYQEAFLVCYQTCKLFDGSTGSKFGSFFKMKFKHHIIDLIRYENTVKRKINLLVEPLGDKEKLGLTTPSHKKTIELKDHIRDVLLKMNQTEIFAMQYIFGVISIEEGRIQAKCNKKQFQRAIYKCRKIITDFDDEDLS